MRLISGTKLDERIIRCDLDPGYKEGRQYGRGKSGGQVRDEYRQEFDSGRGGWGHNRQREEEERRLAEEMEARRRRAHEEVYQEQEREQGGRIVPSGAEGTYIEQDSEQRGAAAMAANGAPEPGPAATKRSRDESDEPENASKVSK